MLYLTECESLLAGGSEAFAATDLRTVRGDSWNAGALHDHWGQGGMRAQPPGEPPDNTHTHTPDMSHPLWLCLLPLQIFGATDEDLDKLRIASLVDMDVERLERLMGRVPPPGGSENESESDNDGSGRQQQGSNKPPQGQ